MQPLVRQTKAYIGITPGYKVSRSIEDFTVIKTALRLDWLNLFCLTVSQRSPYLTNTAFFDEKHFVEIFLINQK